MKSDILLKLHAARRAIETNLPPGVGGRYWLRDALGGGFADTFEFGEAVEVARDATNCTGAIVIENDATQVIAVFVDGRAFVPVELMADPKPHENCCFPGA